MRVSPGVVSGLLAVMAVAALAAGPSGGAAAQVVAGKCIPYSAAWGGCGANSAGPPVDDGGGSLSNQAYVDAAKQLIQSYQRLNSIAAPDSSDRQNAKAYQPSRPDASGTLPALPPDPSVAKDVSSILAPVNGVTVITYPDGTCTGPLCNYAPQTEIDFPSGKCTGSGCPPATPEIDFPGSAKTMHDSSLPGGGKK